MTKLLSDEYHSCSKKIDNLADSLNTVAVQAQVISKTLDKILSEDETSLLVLNIGRVMDKHYADMAKM